MLCGSMGLVLSIYRVCGRGQASDGVRYADARSSVGREARSVTKLRFDPYGGVFLFLQERSKHVREMVITPKASTSTYVRNVVLFSNQKRVEVQPTMYIHMYTYCIYTYTYICIYICLHGGVLVRSDQHARFRVGVVSPYLRRG